MEPRCNYCDFFGEKYHCNNCKIFNGARRHVPREITCSLDELVDYVENTENIEDIEERFGLGDYIYIETYTGEKLKCVIIDYGKDIIASSGETAKVSFGIFNIDGYYQMNTTDTNEGGYSASLGRVRMGRFYQVMPQKLKDHIKPVVKKSSIGSSKTDLVCTEDKLWMFSEVEILGINYYSIPGEGEQYEYFKNEDNRRFNGYKWLRSANSGNSSYFCSVSAGGNADWSYASNACGVALGFCV
jgi:hypothetical protein